MVLKGQFTIELCTLKTTGCHLERLYKRSGLTATLKPTKTTLGLIMKLSLRPKQTTYTTLIGDQQNNPRMFFSTINQRLSPLDVPQFSGAPDLCFRFLDFFQEKLLPFTSTSWHLPSPYHMHLRHGQLILPLFTRLWTLFLLLSWSPRQKPPPALWTLCQ